MADDEKNEEQDAPKSNKMLIIIIALLAVILVGGGVAAFLMMGGDDGGSEDEAMTSTASPAIYFDLKPPFVVNYAWKGRQRYVQINLAIMTRSEQVVGALKKHMPLVRNNLVQIFGAQEFDELRTPDGKEVMRQMALEDLQKIVVDEIGEEGIEQVLFTNFVMQ
ncbi:MAG: flagellar basal body-associated protein FliL [Moraxellaceae bacterium]|nr:MAG: flagellar basal body-associated protein FliL [Moraxellaceae bacterium]